MKKKLFCALPAAVMALGLLAGCSNSSNPGSSNASGTGINVAYHRVNDLFTSGVLGKDPILAEADAAQPGGEMIMYGGGGDGFTAIQNETAFDYKKLGAQMLTDGFDLDAALADLDAKWAARKRAGGSFQLKIRRASYELSRARSSTVSL